MKRRAMSVILLLSMMVSLLPIQVAAEVGQQLENVISDPLILPVGDSGIQTFALEGTTGPFYVPERITSFRIDDEVGYFDTEVSETARLQVIQNGSVLATTDGKNLDCYYDYESDGYYISYPTLYTMSPIFAGTYGMQLVDGTDTVVALDNQLIVTDKIILDYAGIFDLAAGGSNARISTTFLQFDGDPEKLEAKLLDGNLNVVTTVGKNELSSVRAYSDHRVAVDWVFAVPSSVQGGEVYFLSLTYDGSGSNIVTNEDSVSETAEDTPAPGFVSIGAKDSAGGVLSVELDDLVEDHAYSLVVCKESEDGVVLYRNDDLTASAAMPLSVPLLYNGLALPLTAYGDLYLEVQGEGLGGTSTTFQMEESNHYYSQYSDMTLSGSGTSYTFTLVAYNELADLYDAGLVELELREKSAQVGTATILTRDEMWSEKDGYTYTFTGTITTTKVLEQGAYYNLYRNGWYLAGGDLTEETVELEYLSSQEVSNGTFWFRFGALDLTAGVRRSSGSARAELLRNGSVVATSAVVSGEEEGDLIRYEFSIPHNNQVVPGAGYSLRVVDGTAALERSNFTALTYDDQELLSLSYMDVIGTPVAGDTTLDIRMNGAFRNVSVENLAPVIRDNLRLTRTATNQQIVLGAMELVSRDRYDTIVRATLSEETPLVFGHYTYYDREEGGYLSGVDVPAAAAAQLGYLDEDTGLIEGCTGLSSGNYTGKLWLDEGGSYTVTVTFKDAQTLAVTGLPAGTINGDLVVWANGVLLGSCSVYRSASNQEIQITSYYVDENWNFTEFNYLTPEREIGLKIQGGQNCRYVRYSEDKDALSTLPYSAIRAYYDQTLELSEGTGEKSVYIQCAADANGSQPSDMMELRCYYQNMDAPAILDGGILDGRAVIPTSGSDTEFTVFLTANSHLLDAGVKFAYTYSWSDDVYYDAYALDYVGAVTYEGVTAYRFQKTFDGSDFDSDYFQMVLELRALGSGEDDDPDGQMTAPLRFGAPSRVEIEKINGARAHDVYVNDSAATVIGIATPGKTVTVTYTNTGDSTISGSVTCTAGANYCFSVTLPENLADGTYKLKASDGTLSDSSTCYLYVDTVAPTVTSLAAVLSGDSSAQNITVTWGCEDEDVDYYLLSRNGSPVLTAEDGVDSTQFILTVSGMDSLDGESYTVVAVDWAGNQSQPLTKTFGDTEPPTIPENLAMVRRASKTVDLSWDESTDNVAVAGYEIFRNGEKAGSVGAGITAYTDTDLAAGQVHTYTVKAFDKAGNRSQASEGLETGAVAPVFRTVTSAVAEQYMIEAEQEVTLCASASDKDNLEGMTLALQVKLHSASDWMELENWEIADTEIKNYTWEYWGLEAGDYDLRFLLTDRDGGTAEQALFTTLIHDTIKPEVSIVYPMEKTYAKQAEVSVYATDNARMDTLTVFWSRDNQTYAPLYQVMDGGEGDKSSQNTRVSLAYQWDLSQISDGAVYLKAVAADKAGNTQEEIVSLRVDNTPPAVPSSVTATPTQEYIHVLWAFPTVAEDWKCFRVYRSEKENGDFTLVEDNLRSIGYFDSAETGLEANKRYYYYVTSVDTAGNESAAEKVVSAIVEQDLTAPAFVSLLPISGSALSHSTTLQVSVTDNFCLAGLKVEYQAKTDDLTAPWTELTTLTADENAVEQVFSYNWDLLGLDAGTYVMRYTVADKAGNSVNTTVEYVVSSYTAPDAPTNLKTEGGSDHITLTWTAVSGADHYLIYRAAGGQQAVELATVKGVSYTDTTPILGTEYTYYVVAVDQYGGLSAASAAAMATAQFQDRENPVAVLAPDNLSVSEGTAVRFDGSGSHDDDRISSWSWSVDGQTKTGAKVSHTFDTAGTYTVTLTVTDPAGKTGTATTQVKVYSEQTLAAEDRHLVTIHVMDGDRKPVSGAELQVKPVDIAGETVICTTDDQGNAALVLESGNYTSLACKAGSPSSSAQITVTGEQKNFTMVMSELDVVVGELTWSEMTKKEIEAAGIDTSDPDNQHVFKFATVFEFTTDKGKVEIPFTFFKNSKGVILRGNQNWSFGLPGGWGGWGGWGGGGGGTIHPINEHFYLVIYGEAHWMKEMFNVELVVSNQSGALTLADCMAELELPEGLSLADMRTEPQSARVSLGDVEPKGSSLARWYVRGDEEGEYDLTAHVTGTYMPNNEPFALDFTTLKPLKVWAGSALQLNITAHNTAEYGKPYEVEFELINVSNKDLYDLSFAITGCEQYKVTHDENGQDVELISSENPDALIEVERLRPGESLEYTLRTIISFRDFEDKLLFYLRNWFVVAMDGSTTEIPVNFIILDDVLFGGYSTDNSKKGTLTFTVLSEETMEPVEGLWVYSDHLTGNGSPKKTDADGKVVFEDVTYTDTAQIVGVGYEKEALPVLTSKYMVANDSAEYQLYIPSADDPFVTGLTFTSPKGKQRSYNYLSTALYCVEELSDDQYSIEMEVNWQGKEAYAVTLVGTESGKKLSMSTDNNENGTLWLLYNEALGRCFNESEPVEVVLQDSTGEQYRYDFPLIVVDDQLRYIVQQALNRISLPYVETAATHLPYQGIQMLGGSKFKADFTDFNNRIPSFRIELQDDFIEVGVGSGTESYVQDASFLGDNKIKLTGDVWFRMPYSEFGVENVEGGIQLVLKSTKVPFGLGGYEKDKCIIFYKDLHFYLGSVPMVGTVDVGTKFTTRFTVGKRFTGEQANSFYFKGKASPALFFEIGAGPGVPGFNIQWLAEGTGTLHFNFTESTDLRDFIDAEVEIKIIQKENVLIFEFEHDLVTLLHWPDPDAEGEENLKQLEAKVNDGDYSTTWESGRQERMMLRSFSPDATLVSNIFPNTQTGLVEVDGQRMMLLTMEAAGRGDADQLNLVWSRQGVGGWSQPQAVAADDGTLDGEFQAAAGDGAALVVYQDQNKTYGDTVSDVDAYTRTMEMAAARYDAQTERWSVSRLTDDGRADFMPVAAADGERMAAVWASNSVSGLSALEGDTSIRYSFWNGTGWSEVKSIDNVGALNGLSAAWAADDLVLTYGKATEQNGAWSYGVYTCTIAGDGSVSGERKLADDAHSPVTLTVGGELQQAWFTADSVTVLSGGQKQVIAATPQANSLQAVRTGEDATLLWKQTAQVNPDDPFQIRQSLWGSSYYAPRNLWCGAAELVSGNFDVVNESALVNPDGSLLLCCLEQQPGTVSGDTVTWGRADLRTMQVNRTQDLAVDPKSFTYDDAAYAAGRKTMVQFTFGAIGSLPVDGAEISLYAGSNANSTPLATQTMETLLCPGDGYTFTAEVDVPKSVRQLYLDIQPLNGTDTDPDNNGGEVLLGQVDLAVADGYFQYQPGGYEFTAQIANRGSVQAEKVTVNLRADREDGEIVYTDTHDTLSHNEYELFHCILPKDSVAFASGTRSYFVEILCAGESEEKTMDNVAVFFLRKPADVTVTEPDGGGDSGDDSESGGSDSDSGSGSGGGSSSGGVGGGGSASTQPNKPSVEVGEGGSTTLNQNGSMVIRPDAGYEIGGITINGKPVKIPVDGVVNGLKPTDKVEVTFLSASGCSGGTCPSGVFTDVPADQWYHAAVDYAVAKGLFAGTSATTFEPNAAMSRAMLVTVLYSLSGETWTGAASGFKDVADEAWYARAVAWAAAKDIVSGYSDERFGPNDPVTREQIAAVLRKYAAYRSLDTVANGVLDEYVDRALTSDWAEEAVRWAVDNGLISGKPGKRLDPQGKATRAEVATMLKAFLRK